MILKTGIGGRCVTGVSIATPVFFYVANHLGRAGWLDSATALDISTDGYVQRQRVQQAKQGDLDWLRPARLSPPPPLMSPDEVVYLTLRAVTYQNAPPAGFFVRADQGDVLDSGKFYVTGKKLHLLGQRRDWSHRLEDVARVTYDAGAWTVFIHTTDRLQQYRGVTVDGQFDPQLIASIVDALRYKR